MKAICTICSKVKDEREELLPARLRYLGPHVHMTEKIAADEKVPFYILSGKFGFISGDNLIPNYDYYLEATAVDALSKVISEQLQADHISEVDFYTELKPTWASYESAIRTGCELADVTLHIHSLS